MAQTESKGGGGAAVGTIVGFLCGVGIGLLFARKPGSETRQDIKELLNRGRKKGEQLIEQGREKLSGVTSEGGKEPFYESGSKYA